MSWIVKQMWQHARCDIKDNNNSAIDNTTAFMVCEVTIFTIEEDSGIVGHGAI
jgi:hypothetical protein